MTKITLEELVGDQIDWEEVKKLGETFDCPKTNPNCRYLFTTYYIGLKEGLTDYQARSFASELTLFLTGEMFSTGTELVYLEYRLDTYCQSVYQDLNKVYDDAKKEFWLAFKDYLLNFYKSVDSWDYERVTYKINLKLTDKELYLLKSLGCKSYRLALRKFLLNYDYGLEEDLIPPNRDDWRITTTHIGISEKELLMKIPPQDTTKKFLQVFYYYFKDKF